MKLSDLTIRKPWNDGDPYRGSVSYEDPAGEIKLNIPPEKLSAVLEVVADALVDITQDAARVLREAITRSAEEMKPADAIGKEVKQ
jgi:hypothetical protein